ncbi:MAG: DMT family transporter [Pseudomonadota bacterium]
MLVFSALVAGSFSLGNRVANDIDPAALNFVRFVLAIALLSVVLAWRRPAIGPAFQAPWRYLVLGALFATYFILMFEGLKTAPATQAAAVFTLTPLMSAGFGYLLLGQRTTPRIALGLGLGGLAAAWVIFRADLSAFLAFEVGRGEMIYFVGCVAHALYTPMVPKLNRGESPLVFTLGMMIGALIWIGIYGAPALLATQWSALPPLVWITIGYTAIFASAATFTLLQYASLRIPSSKVMAYTYLTPSWVLLWELAFGAKAPSLLILSGVLATVLALFILLKDD